MGIKGCAVNEISGEKFFVFFAQKCTKKGVKILLKNNEIKWENHLAFSLGR